MSEDSTKKEKPICFVIMPIADVHGYDPGHFGRVYEYVLKPAIMSAGYHPIRADDTAKTDYIVVGIIQKIIESEMVLCDFSARNPNVMYELGLRHAFGKPTTLIKDIRTDKVFDIQGLRYTEYDESLRIDSVQKDISKISNAIKETANSSSNSINSVVQLAGIAVAEVPASQTVSPDTKLLLDAIATLEKRIDIINMTKKKQRFFRIENYGVIFNDGSEAVLGDKVYDSSCNEIGILVDIHPSEEKIFITQGNGKTIFYVAESLRSKELSATDNDIPF